MSTAQLAQFFAGLSESGYRIIGPTVRDDVIILDEIAGPTDLPVGWTDRQDAAAYHLERMPNSALFGYVVGPQSWKKYLYPPRLELWQAARNKRAFELKQKQPEPPKLAFVGVRPCELAAIEILDRVLTGGEFSDEYYRRQRENTFIIAVNCTEPGGTCFCASMGTGPRARHGYDIVLTEVVDDSGHRLLVDTGSEAGLSAMSKLTAERASNEIQSRADELLSRAAGRMGRSLDTADLRELLYRNIENVYWDRVGKRCLTCANCTLVCPTCFCFATEDTTDLEAHRARRERRWDSCFTMDFSYIHGGSVRPSAKSRYRQWLTHKLAAWHDQFGSSGCVGCGRCITWCPVGIDITEEVCAIREHDPAQATVTEESNI
ncbi:MAG: 4Fe-4S dicluster domain-containing protein [Candidatus Zixiibacteriota bacterium]|nr:MAG: 4Fe-4S dicluster domain-containing protein [candidate division Zixibacteria bacterium]